MVDITRKTFASLIQVLFQGQRDGQICPPWRSSAHVHMRICVRCTTSDLKRESAQGHSGHSGTYVPKVLMSAFQDAHKNRCFFSKFVAPEAARFFGPILPGFSGGAAKPVGFRQYPPSP
jgi:hypothetical protein